MAENSMQAEVRELQNQIANLKDLLAKQGHDVADQVREGTSVALNGASRRVGQAANYARNEAASVAGIVREHPTATSTALLTIGLLGGLVGYFLASSAQTETQRRRWY